MVIFIVLNNVVQLVDENLVLLVKPLRPVLLLDSHSKLIEPVLAIVGASNKFSLFAVFSM